MPVKPLLPDRNQSRKVQLYKGKNLFELAWIGPTVAQTDHEGNQNPNYPEQIAALKREFQAHNAIAEVINNWRDGLVGEPFTISVRRKDGEEELDEAGKQAISDLSRWRNWVQEQAVQLSPSTTTFQQTNPWAEFVLKLGVCGESALRVFTPLRYANDADELKRIHLHVPTNLEVEYNDEYGAPEKAIYRYQSRDTSYEETHEQLDGDPYTITVRGGAETGSSLVIDSGLWRVFSVAAPSLITESAEAKQAAICHELTMLVRNQQHSGFRRRTYLNAQVPDEPLPTGVGVEEYAHGVAQQDTTTGEVKYATPAIHESEPFPVSNSVESVRLFRELLFTEFSQGHLLENGGDISGESRVQQRQNFDVLLRGWSERIEAAFAHVFNVVLEQLGYSDQYEAVIDLSITTGKLSSDEQTAIIGQYREGLLSAQSAIAMLGNVSDVQAELAKISAEREDTAAMIEQDFEEGGQEEASDEQ